MAPGLARCAPVDCKSRVAGPGQRTEGHSRIATCRGRAITASIGARRD